MLKISREHVFVDETPLNIFRMLRYNHHHPLSSFNPVYSWRPMVAGCTSFPQRSLSLSLFLHLARFAASSIPIPVIFTFSSTCLLHVCSDLPRFRCPFTSSMNDHFRTLSYSPQLRVHTTLLHSILPFCQMLKRAALLVLDL